VIAAGGTGGHMFPAQALAEAMLARGWRVKLSTDARGARYAGGFPEAVEIEQVIQRPPSRAAARWPRRWCRCASPASSARGVFGCARPARGGGGLRRLPDDPGAGGGAGCCAARA
jgi:hypothetical protein